MAFLRDIDQLRQIEWSKSYLWDVKFNNAPKPFNEWFPATEVTENTANLNSMPVEGGNSGFKIPQSKAATDVSITFIDDINNTLYTWISNWLNSITKGQVVSTLAECTQMVHVAKLANDRSIIDSTSYLVYPEGNISFAGNSNSDTRQYTVSFVIVATPGENSNTQSRLTPESSELLPPLLSRGSASGINPLISNPNSSIPSGVDNIASLQSSMPKVPTVQEAYQQLGNKILDTSQLAKVRETARNAGSSIQSIQDKINSTKAEIESVKDNLGL